ncbi:hypothetical protein CEXT_352221 [Caerostris extrusa]|uniref:C2H2-type domain-containing protein n=1 Tax=Caerostris extrusa TaxID=172846 RepID=A0AAV4WL66_CAEEX|nr:hypothetical protein CEXT_352221 [Caerostris extrusa]
MHCRQCSMSERKSRSRMTVKSRKRYHTLFYFHKDKSKAQTKLLLPSLRFYFSHLEEQDDHLVVHVLEEQFNKLHGLRSNAASSTKQCSTSRLATASAPACSDTVRGPTLSCDHCERDGFPNKKALRYHLFRIHQISMGRPDASRPTAPLSPGPPQVTHTGGSSPTAATASDIGHSADSELQAIRDASNWCLRFPLLELFVAPTALTPLRGKSGTQLREEDGEKTEGHRQLTPPLGGELQIDADQSLAQPVRDSPVPISQDAPVEEEKGPLDHYIEPLNNSLSCDPRMTLSDFCSQIIAEGKSFLSLPEPASSARSHNGPDIQDPQTCQKLYRRNRRRAVREIIGNNSERCKVPPTNPHSAFRQCLARWKTIQ